MCESVIQHLLPKLGDCKIPGEDDSWDFGTGAGFYVDATEEKWKTNYRMFSYVTKELPSLVAANFKVESDKAGIMGHRYEAIFEDYVYMYLLMCLKERKI